MDILPVVLSLIIGLVIGSGISWIIIRKDMQNAVEKTRLEAEKEAATLQERIEQNTANLNSLQALNKELTEENESLKQSRHTLEMDSQVQIAEANEKLRAAEEKIRLIDEAKTKLTDVFKALSSEALKENNAQFIAYAKQILETFQEQAKGDIEQRKQAVETLFGQIKEKLSEVDINVKEIEKARIDAYAGLTEQVKQLSDTQTQLKSETNNLVKALRAPAARGRWGEIQLKNVVRMAGMQAYCDFEEQATTQTENGALRPDMIIRLPNDKIVIVDSKTPLEAYLDAVEASDEQAKTTALKRHAAQVKEHITNLSAKHYWTEFNSSPEFVVLFIPGESFLSAALEQDHNLIDYGASKQIMLATPTTLIALLKAVAFGWKQARIAESAENISKLGIELYERIATMTNHLENLGNKLNQAVQAYNQSIGSFEGRVLVSARKFNELGVIGRTEISELSPLDATPRALNIEKIPTLPPTNYDARK